MISRRKRRQAGLTVRIGRPLLSRAFRRVLHLRMPLCGSLVAGRTGRPRRRTSSRGVTSVTRLGVAASGSIRPGTVGSRKWRTPRISADELVHKTGVEDFVEDVLVVLRRGGDEKNVVGFAWMVVYGEAKRMRVGWGNQSAQPTGCSFGIWTACSNSL